MLVRSLNHVTCVTGDLEALVAFYEEVFGATVERFDGLHAFVHLGETTVLHVFERAESAPAPFRPHPHGALAFEATDEDAFLAVRDRLLGRGDAAAVVDRGSLASVRFRDPDGRVHELARWRTADWSPRFAAGRS